MKTVLAPIDFSPGTRSVVAEAVALAREFSARLVLFHVVRPVPLLPATFGLPQSGAELPAATVDAAVRKMHRLQRELLAKSVTAHTVHVVGEPAVEIVAEAERLEADFIVLGRRGHTALYDLVIGSTVQGVLRYAPCPVVMVPRTGKQAGRGEASPAAEARMD